MNFVIFKIHLTRNLVRIKSVNESSSRDLSPSSSILVNPSLGESKRSSFLLLNKVFYSEQMKTVKRSPVNNGLWEVLADTFLHLRLKSLRKDKLSSLTLIKEFTWEIWIKEMSKLWETKLTCLRLMKYSLRRLILTLMNYCSQEEREIRPELSQSILNIMRQSIFSRRKTILQELFLDQHLSCWNMTSMWPEMYSQERHQKKKESSRH